MAVFFSVTQYNSSLSSLNPNSSSCWEIVDRKNVHMLECIIQEWQKEKVKILQKKAKWGFAS